MTKEQALLKIEAAKKLTIGEKTEIRKAGGVYYTPPYIVDYIVKQTVGIVVAGKAPGDISNIKIVDPSCGSGNFLIGAYQFLLDWHRNYYNNYDKPSKEKKSFPLTLEGNLTTDEKKRILVNNIYGVDLDVNAVEVTKLILLLKCMEGETGVGSTKKAAGILPALDNNIKTGNSLVDMDFFDSKKNRVLEKKINPFNWEKEFPGVFSRGGFDIVIGNPPYGAVLTKEIQKYCLKKFNVGNTDTAALFMVQAKQILRPHGYNGYIIPKSFTYASNWAKTRKELLSDISMIIDCSKVWPKVKLEMSIYISSRDLKAKEFTTCIRKGEEIIEIGKINKSLCDQFDFILNGVSNKEIRTGLKLFNSPKRLNDFLSNRRGGMFQKKITAKGDYKVIGGKQVQRYFISTGIKRKIRKTDITEENAFINKNSILVQNIIAHIQNPFPRIQITATIVDRGIANESVILDTVNQLSNNSGLSIKYLLGVLNSKPVSWYTYRFVFANAIRTMHFDSINTAKIPFPNINLKNRIHKARYEYIIKTVDQIAMLKKGLKTDKPLAGDDLISKKVNHLQDQIDLAVSELFGLIQSEIEIIK